MIQRLAIALTLIILLLMGNQLLAQSQIGPAQRAKNNDNQSSRNLTKDDVDRMMTELSNWGRWGKDDQLGAINLLTPAKRKEALKLVKEGAAE